MSSIPSVGPRLLKASSWSSSKNKPSVTCRLSELVFEELWERGYISVVDGRWRVLRTTLVIDMPDRISHADAILDSLSTFYARDLVRALSRLQISTGIGEGIDFTNVKDNRGYARIVRKHLIGDGNTCNNNRIVLDDREVRSPKATWRKIENLFSETGDCFTLELIEESLTSLTVSMVLTQVRRFRVSSDERSWLCMPSRQNLRIPLLIRSKRVPSYVPY